MEGCPCCRSSLDICEIMSAQSVKITLPNGKEYDQPTGLFINNEFVASKSGKTFSTLNPTTEKNITEVYEAAEEDVELAVNAATKAFETWGVLDPTKRGNYLYKLADAIEENLDIIAAIDSIDNGKPFFMAQGEVSFGMEVVRNYAGWANKIYGDVIESGEGHFSYTKREPIGVCGQIIPWNGPFLMWTWKIAPAVACGNTVILKSAESTPLSALFACSLVQKVGFPPGVINVLSGDGKVGQVISSHMKIQKVAFTGSTATGRNILRSAATSNLKKVTLELGGKSPNIIFADADLEKAVEIANLGIYANSGEVCVAGSRIYVQEEVYEKFLEAFKVRSEKNVLGDPFAADTFQGPQTSKVQLDRILSYIDHGKKEGARLVTGGERLERPGYFVKPTVFADVNEDMKIVKEEIFGPVVTVSKFKTVEEVIKLANDTNYGLGAGIMTNDINKATYVASRLKAGTVWVNTFTDLHPCVPFGGYNQSGIGRELGKEALDSYTQTKAVRIRINIPQ